MPDTTPCIRCGRIGLVRREHVIKAGQALIAYYCGSCNRSWQVADAKKDAASRPERRRPPPDVSR